MLSPWIVTAGRAALALALGLAITFTSGHTAEFGLIAFGVFAVLSGALLLAGWFGTRAPAEGRTAFRAAGIVSVAAGVAALVVDFDYCARVLKSAQKRDLLSSVECHEKLHTLKKHIRSIFERVVYFQKYLSREEMKPLSRADFLPSADEEAKKRVKAAVGIFGECPRDVFNGDKQPRHSRRHVEMSEEEYNLLNTVPLTGEETAAVSLI